MSNWVCIWQLKAPDNSCWGETRYTSSSDLHPITWARALTMQCSQGTSPMMSVEAIWGTFPVCHIRGALTQLCAVRNQVDSLDLEHLNPLSHFKEMNTEHSATRHDSSPAPVFMSHRALTWWMWDNDLTVQKLVSNLTQVVSRPDNFVLIRCTLAMLNSRANPVQFWNLLPWEARFQSRQQPNSQHPWWWWTRWCSSGGGGASSKHRLHPEKKKSRSHYAIKQKLFWMGRNHLLEWLQTLRQKQAQ